MNSYVHIDNKKYILIPGKSPGLNDTMITAEAGYSINFTKQLFIYKSSKNLSIKAKESELIGYPLCLVNVKYNMKETGLNGWVYDFSVDYYSVDVDGIFDIHRYLMKSIDVRYCLSL